MTLINSRDGEVFYLPQVFHTSQNYFSKLLTKVNWQTEQVQVYGRWHRLRRQTAWYGTANYQYSGQTKVAQAWLPEILEIRDKVQESRVDRRILPRCSDETLS